jgi:hypothetical protein
MERSEWLHLGSEAFSFLKPRRLPIVADLKRPDYRQLKLHPSEEDGHLSLWSTGRPVSCQHLSLRSIPATTARGPAASVRLRTHRWKTARGNQLPGSGQSAVRTPDPGDVQSCSGRPFAQRVRSLWLRFPPTSSGRLLVPSRAVFGQALAEPGNVGLRFILAKRSTATPSMIPTSATLKTPVLKCPIPMFKKSKTRPS